jgi:putative drug exporter of the RND superfamily
VSPPTPQRHHARGRLGRLADAVFVHRRKVIVAWIAVLVLASVGGTAFGGEFTADYNTPGTGSAEAAERLEQKFGGRSGDAVDIVWRSADGARSPAATERVDRLLKEAGSVQGVVPGTTTESAEVSRDGQTAIARLALDRPAGHVEAATGERIAALVAEANVGGVTVAANSTIAGLNEEPEAWAVIAWRGR